MKKIKAQIKALWARFKLWVYALLVSLGLIAGVAMADDVSLNWTNAVMWDDGTTLVAGDLVETVLDYQLFALDADITVAPRVYVELVRLPATQTSHVHTNVPNGIHCYVAYHVASNGQRSAYSNESCKTVDVRLPGSPSGLTSN